MCKVTTKPWFLGVFHILGKGLFTNPWFVQSLVIIYIGTILMWLDMWADMYCRFISAERRTQPRTLNSMSLERFSFKHPLSHGFCCYQLIFQLNFQLTIRRCLQHRMMCPWNSAMSCRSEAQATSPVFGPEIGEDLRNDLCVFTTVGIYLVTLWPRWCWLHPLLKVVCKINQSMCPLTNTIMENSF